MDASVRRSHHNHHHYHHYHHHCHFICHLRHRHFICHHSPALPIPPPPPPPPPPAPGLQIPDPVTSVIARDSLNSEALRPEEAQHGGSSAAQMWQGQEYDEQMEEYDDYDEEPVFVLTDEWREFFAKSEAKRKQEKKQAKKKAKN